MCCFVRAQIVYHIADTWLHMAVHTCNTYLYMAVLTMGHRAVQGCVSFMVIDGILMSTALCWQLVFYRQFNFPTMPFPV